MPSQLQISRPFSQTQSAPLSTYQRFRVNPARFVTDWIYAHQPPIASMQPVSQLKARRSDSILSSDPHIDRISVVCISDTHNTTPSNIPPGDILLHAGDLSNKGTFEELQTQLTWLNTLPHVHKVVISGNHDALLDEAFITSYPERISREDVDRRNKLEWGSITYLNNTSTKILIRGRSVTIYGCPMTPQCGTFAFQYLPIRDIWKGTIPEGTDVVLTHGPPKGYLDDGGKGCHWLLRELWRTKPLLVVCGHIHGGRGRVDVTWDTVQSGYDFGGAVRMVKMLIALLWIWIARVVMGKKRLGRTVIVNAAIEDGAASANVVEI